MSVSPYLNGGQNYKALALKVIVVALQDLNGNDVRAREDAQRWFREPDDSPVSRTHPFSVLNCCHILDTEPEFLRDRVQRALEKDTLRELIRSMDEAVDTHLKASRDAEESGNSRYRSTSLKREATFGP